MDLLLQNTKMLLFSIQKHVYALPAEQVKEITMQTDLFFIPCSPSYVSGYMNYHSTPYTTCNLHTFFYREDATGTKQIVLKTPDDGIAFIAQEIIGMTMVERSSILPIHHKEVLYSYCLGRFIIDKTKIAIINVAAIIECLEQDLQS